MKKTDFLSKLRKEKKLQIVEASNEISKAYLTKSSKTLKSSKAILKIENYEDSVALAYYSMYYSLLSLLFKTGIKCENHTGSIILLKKIFDIDNTDIQQAKKERVDKQYYVDFSVTKEEVINAIKKTERFNALILNKIETISNEEIKEYREKAEFI